ncbi:hypothetical protein E3T54_11840 [Cryobacterium sp. Sr8]|uniref:hypothetical protein n=1 Tax=Cryobacterium sp. Sr8 TaxID=1259203 RepID=UPI00106C77EA|nr:hypothetical protein [Cryobacterium sp. Sr8]TFD75417.1 hypothetical protein E3T54_11840 [Cryobacterium sp. Sr8]
MTKTTPTALRNTPSAAQLSDNEAISVAQALVRLSAESHNLNAQDVEDIAQDAILDALGRNGSGGLTEAVLLNAVTQAIEIEMSRRTGTRSEDLQALAALDELIGLEQSILERDLTDDEWHDLARSVRSGWEATTQLPSAGFAWRPVGFVGDPHGVPHEGHRVVSLNDPQVSAEAHRVEALPLADGSEDWLEDELDAGLLTLDQARQKAWNHFSADNGVPRTPDRMVGMKTTEAAVEDVRTRGGVIAVASSLLERGAEPDWGDPLFTPWPFADEAGRRRIAELLAGTVASSLKDCGNQQSTP